VRKILALVALLAVALAVPASAITFPVSFTFTVAQNTSVSSTGFDFSSLSVSGVSGRVAASPVMIIPPAALEATSAQLEIEVCSTSAYDDCVHLSDEYGVQIGKFTIVGGATPTSAIFIEPRLAATLRYVQFRITTSAGVHVSQATAARTFTVFVRPL
jgi:hypothetical protein